MTDMAFAPIFIMLILYRCKLYTIYGLFLHALHCTLSEMLRAECAPEICSQANVTSKVLLKVTLLHVLHLICAWRKIGSQRCIGYIVSALCALYLLLQYGIYIKAYGCILLDTHFYSSSKRIGLLPIRHGSYVAICYQNKDLEVDSQKMSVNKALHCEAFTPLLLLNTVCLNNYHSLQN